MSILPLLRSTGGLPLNELHLRASGSWQDVSEELKSLIEEGLVEVQGALPSTSEEMQRSRVPVMLTQAGTKRMFK